MTRIRPASAPSAAVALPAAALLAAAVVLGACAPSPTPRPIPAPTPTPSAAPQTPGPVSAAEPGPTAEQSPSVPGTVVSLASVGRLGPILVDAQGRTLYLYDVDTSTRSTCVNGCAESWPAVTTAGDPVAGPGVDEGLLGAAPREGGPAQVLYKGHPLYRFSGDRSPGDTNGQAVQDFAGYWYALNALGDGVQGD